MLSTICVYPTRTTRHQSTVLPTGINQAWHSKPFLQIFDPKPRLQNAFLHHRKHNARHFPQPRLHFPYYKRQSGFHASRRGMGQATSSRSTIVSPFFFVIEDTQMVYNKLANMTSCNPTGPNICNFGLAKTNVHDGGYYDAYVYNSNCDLIGSVSNQIGAGDFDLDSQLPWVVVFNGFYVHFWYAGTFYSWSKQECISYDDTEAGNAVWQCAFSC
jgi:hypothetical protein